jgi:hypothetical protein
MAARFFPLLTGRHDLMARNVHVQRCRRMPAFMPTTHKSAPFINSRSKSQDHCLVNGIYRVRDNTWYCVPNDHESVPELPQTDEDYDVMRQRTARHYLNFISLPELLANLDILTHQQQNLLLSTLNRIEHYPQRFAREGQKYAETAGIMLMTDAPYSKEFGLCGVCGRRCLRWRICPACCHVKRMVILKKFLPRFCRGNRFFCTSSFTGFMVFDALVHVYWAACEYAIRTMVNERYFEGAFVYEAIEMHSYFPCVLVVPHVHMVIVADAISSAVMAMFRELVQSYRGQVWNRKKRRYEDDPEWRVRLPVQPTTRTYSIDEMADYCNILNYLVLPVDVVTPYRAAWPLAKANFREFASLLNQNVTEALFGWASSMDKRDGHYYRGAMHHRSRSFVGVKKSIRETKAHERRVAALLHDCNDANLNGFPYADKASIEEQSKQIGPQGCALDQIPN